MVACALRPPSPPWTVYSSMLAITFRRNFGLLALTSKIWRSIFVVGQFPLTTHTQNSSVLFFSLSIAKSSRNLMFNEHKNKELRHELMKLVRRQVTVMDITDQLVDVYTIMIFAHFLSAAIIMCFASMLILTVRYDSCWAPSFFGSEGAHINLKISIIQGAWSRKGFVRELHSSCHGAIVHVCTQWNNYCWKCRFRCLDCRSIDFYILFLHTQSSQIAIAAYSMEWHHSNRTVRQIILMMIRRSQEAKVVRIPFFGVSLEAYTKIMSTAGSYIAVLNSMLQKWKFCRKFLFLATK